MKVGVLGTGTVGQTIATKLVQLQHAVMLGSRTADNDAAAQWVASAGDGASQGTFADAAAFGELVLNCTAGVHSLSVIESVAGALANKTLIDVANPLDFSGGFPPKLSVCNDDSLAEQLQRAAPDARVVKALNMVGAAVMVEPERLPGDHDALIAGNDEAAKAATRELLTSFGWTHILDLGDLSAARGMEAYLLLWLRLYGATNTGDLNFHITTA